MKQLFKYDTPIMMVLGKIADLAIVNLLFILCSIPIFTIGASITAMYRTLFALQADCGSLTTVFFRSFKQNFKQATFIWLVFIAVFAVVGLDLCLFSKWGVLHKPSVTIVTVVVCFIIMAIFSHLFAFLSRFTCGTIQLFTNTLALCAKQIRVTICMVIINILPLAMFLFATSMFLVISVLWVGIGFALCAYANVILLKNTYASLLPQEYEA